MTRLKACEHVEALLAVLESIWTEGELGMLMEPFGNAWMAMLIEDAAHRFTPRSGALIIAGYCYHYWSYGLEKEEGVH